MQILPTGSFDQPAKTHLLLYPYPLTAPSFSPEIKYLCIARKKIIIGMVAIIEPAAINLQLEENIPCRLFIPTGRVYIESLVSIILGHKNSPQEPIKVNIARTAKIGMVT